MSYWGLLVIYKTWYLFLKTRNNEDESYFEIKD